ncbi:Response regulator receiver domain-containing protein [Natronoarchaeum philippinense]|uniref:Response regulator receiver domain-containing protein n=1 Tax=Natronoarchaeum philippinense TaxID=558529 RepID=A0A285N4D3_NATPI|nr:HalX domain-containing protein [Natronoarchaeum philippinense]SNZ02591.1 Response regulator receiver domain-containing protein [Natronoarchaeum philippinense]
MDEQRGIVLVVDDDPRVARVYAEQLRRQHTVRVAYSGADALESLDTDVDVVLLDRRMPDQTGDEVLEQIRARGLTCQVAMVTAVEPDFDIIEMDFDEYLYKPVTGDQLLSTVDHLLRRATYDTALQEFFSVAAKRAALESEKPLSVLQESDEFATLTARFERLREELDESLHQLDDEEAFELALSDQF